MKAQFPCQLSVCLCAVLLAACGSSGGGSSGSAATSNSNTGSVPTTNQSGSGNTVATPKINFGGTIDKTTNMKSRFSDFAKQSDVSGSNLNTVVIDGKSVNLVPNGVGGRWIVTSDSTSQHHIYTGLSYTRFGVYTNKVMSDVYNTYTLAHGQLTDVNKVPTTGQANYVGYAVYTDANTADIAALDRQKGWANANAQFAVDYGNKTISGSISSPEKYFNTVNLKGTISGNAFSGTNDGYNMNGRFFGPNAEELDGTFHKGTKDRPEVLGSFGAKKQ